MYGSILLPTDGSETAKRATDRAIEMADQHDATLHALYVAEKTRDDPERKGFEEKVTEELKRGNDVIGDVERRAADAEVGIETTVEPGVPRTTIEDYAADRDVGLIVIGSTGASDVTDKLLGTVAKYVVNEAPADVLVVRSDAKLE